MNYSEKQDRLDELLKVLDSNPIKRLISKGKGTTHKYVVDYMPLSYKILRIFSLSAIVLWPFAISKTMDLFASSEINVFILAIVFLSVIAYPICLIANLIVSNKVFYKNYKIAIIMLLWPLLFAELIFMYAFVW